jgi:hypothetical protein
MTFETMLDQKRANLFLKELVACRLCFIGAKALNVAEGKQRR